MHQKHFVVIKDDSGKPAIFPLKAWCRENTDKINFEPHGSTHFFRSNLIKEGWIRRDAVDTVYLIKPDESGDITYSELYIADIEETAREAEIQYDEEAEEMTFSLERDLQDALRTNISQLEPDLKIADGGKERVTDAGRIDITATDKKGGLVIIELKAGTAKTKAISQLLAYMGAVAESDKKPVSGILIAGDFEKNAVWAASAVPNIQLKKYSYKFSFKDV